MKFAPIRTVLLLVLLMVWPTSMFASTLVSSGATLDWTGFKITTTGGLTTSYAGCSGTSAVRTVAGEQVLSSCPSSASFNYSTTDAFGNGKASIFDGVVTSTAQAGTGQAAFGVSSAASQTSNFFVSAGAGTLTVTIDYHLSVSCSQGLNGFYDAGGARVSIASVGNLLPGKGDEEFIECVGNSNDYNGWCLNDQRLSQRRQLFIFGRKRECGCGRSG